MPSSSDKPLKRDSVEVSNAASELQPWEHETEIFPIQSELITAIRFREATSRQVDASSGATVSANFVLTYESEARGRLVRGAEWRRGSSLPETKIKRGQNCG